MTKKFYSEMKTGEVATALSTATQKLAMESGDVLANEELSAGGVLDLITKHHGAIANIKQGDRKLTDILVQEALSISAKGNERTRFVGGFNKKAATSAPGQHVASEDLGVDELVMEGFDAMSPSEYSVLSLAFNVNLDQIDTFTRTLYPLVTLTGSDMHVGFRVTTSYVQKDQTYSETDKAGLHRKQLTLAYRDKSILAGEATKLVPIRRAQSNADFSTAVGAKTIKYRNTDVSTAPLLAGKNVNILRLGQTDAMLGQGKVDGTDSVAPGAKVSKVYVELADNDVLEFDVGVFSNTTFLTPRVGNTDSYTLFAELNQLKVTNATKTVAGVDMAGKANIGTRTVVIGMVLSGSINRETGATFVSGAGVQVLEVREADGTILATSDAAYTTIATLFAGAVVESYTVDANASNSNARVRGTIIINNTQEYVYSVDILSPYTSMVPHGGTQDEQSALQGISSAAFTEINVKAAAKTLELAEQLRMVTAAPDGEYQTVGPVGEKLVKVSFTEAVVDVITDVASLDNASFANNLQETLVNHVRNMVNTLYVNSNLQAARTMVGKASEKPLVIIACGSKVARYLQVSGDLRLLGDEFDHQVVTTLASEFDDKVFVTFGSRSALDSGEVDALHFGTMVYKPAVPMLIPTSRNGGSHVKELRVQPMYRLYCNLPIAGVLRVNNIDSALKSKAVIFNKVQP